MTQVGADAKYIREIEVSGTPNDADTLIYNSATNKFEYTPQTGGGGVASTVDVTCTAGENIGGNRVVILDDDGLLYYASKGEPTHAIRVLGITTGAISISASGPVRTYGVMIEPGWNWTLKQTIYLSANGLLTQTVPTSDFLLAMGFPLSTTSMMIKIGFPITIA